MVVEIEVWSYSLDYEDRSLYNAVYTIACPPESLSQRSWNCTGLIAEEGMEATKQYRRRHA